MIHWEAHACLPLHPDADFAPIDRLHAAGVNYVSINIGMDMNPLSQVMSVIGGFRATIAAHPDRYRLAASADDIELAATDGVLSHRLRSGRRDAAARAAGDGGALPRSRGAPDAFRVQPQQQRRGRLP